MLPGVASRYGASTEGQSPTRGGCSCWTQGSRRSLSHSATGLGHDHHDGAAISKDDVTIASSNLLPDMCATENGLYDVGMSDMLTPQRLRVEPSCYRDCVSRTPLPLSTTPRRMHYNDWATEGGAAKPNQTPSKPEVRMKYRPRRTANPIGYSTNVFSERPTNEGARSWTGR